MRFAGPSASEGRSGKAPEAGVRTIDTPNEGNAVRCGSQPRDAQKAYC
jgi:hypothetical protein